MAQSHSGDHQASDEMQLPPPPPPQQQHQQQAADANIPNDRGSLTPEQQKEVLKGLASLLATALTKQQQQQQQQQQGHDQGPHLAVSDSGAPHSGGHTTDELLGPGNSSDVTNASGLRQRRNTRGQSTSH